MSERPADPDVLPADRVLAHGFDFRPRWWQKRTPAAWSDWLSHLPEAETGGGYRHITRADLLNGWDGTPDGAARLLVAGYVWGTGAWGFLVPRRARVFRDTTPDDIARRLTDAAMTLREQGPVAAYRGLDHGGESKVKHLGPSFFTKFLYAADACDGKPGRALILDQFVAIALNYLEGWDLPERGPWTQEQYARWLDYAQAQARERSDAVSRGTPARSDAIELALFAFGREHSKRRRADPRVQVAARLPCGD